MCSHKPQQGCTNVEPSSLSRCTQLYFLTLSRQPKGYILLFPPLSERLSKGTRRQIQWYHIAWNGRKEREDRGWMNIMPWYLMFIDQVAIKWCQWREGECTTKPVMNYLCIHPFAETLRKGGDSQEGLSHLSLPFSMGRWGLPVGSGAAVQQWALSTLWSHLDEVNLHPWALPTPPFPSCLSLCHTINWAAAIVVSEGAPSVPQREADPWGQQLPMAPVLCATSWSLLH